MPIAERLKGSPVVLADKKKVETAPAKSEQKWTFAPLVASVSVFALAGALCWVSPSEVLSAAGLDSNNVPARLYMRQVGAWQLVAACVLWTGHVNGVQAASRAALLASALAVLACIPVNEYLDRPKNEAVAGVVTLAALGILNGRLGGPRVAAGVLSFIGLLIHFTPIETAELYQIQAEQRSPLLFVMISLMGVTIFTSGLFVGALAMGLAHPRALAGSLLANAVLTSNLATRDAAYLGIGAPKTAPLVWSVITTGLAASALVLSR